MKKNTDCQLENLKVRDNLRNIGVDEKLHYHSNAGEIGCENVVSCTYLYQSRVQWRSVVNKEMERRVS